MTYFTPKSAKKYRENSLDCVMLNIYFYFRSYLFIDIKTSVIFTIHVTRYKLGCQ